MTFKKYIVDTNCIIWFNNELRRLKRKKINLYQTAILKNSYAAW